MPSTYIIQHFGFSVLNRITSSLNFYINVVTIAGDNGKPTAASSIRYCVGNMLSLGRDGVI